MVRFVFVSLSCTERDMTFLFQVMTLQGWNFVLYMLQDTYSVWCLIWFVPLIIIGPFFALQLFLVVIANRYAEVKLEQKKSDENTLCLFDVKIGIVAAKDLPRMDTFGNSDPYVKVQLDRKTKKTKIIKNTLYPQWNEYFVLPVTSLSAQLVSFSFCLL